MPTSFVRAAISGPPGVTPVRFVRQANTGCRNVRPTNAQCARLPPPSGGAARPILRRVAAHEGFELQRLPALDGVAPAAAAEAFRDLPGLALLESARPGRAARWSFLTADPVDVLAEVGPDHDPFAPARAQLCRLAGAGARPAGASPVTARPAGASPVTARPDGTPPFAGGLVGYLAYDVGRHLERLPSFAADDQHLPELRLALHDWVIAWDGRTGAAWLAGRALDGDARTLLDRLAAVEARATRSLAPAAPSAAVRADTLASPRFTSGLSHAEWVRRVERIRAAIAAGDCYQVNLARRLEVPFAGEPWPLHRRLTAGEPAGFAAYLDLGPDEAGRPRAIMSASPEPFLALDAAGHVRADPIKGTRPRGRTRDEDRALAAELLASGKDRAENTMIVDVLRNDLGRACRAGSVRVARLARLERTPSVQHLVSTISGRLAAGRDAFDLLAAAFPGGSITGAPKIRAMELIEELEPVRRGPYCGAALWIDADGAMGSSILIRTFVADGRRLSLHVGGGITWRSDPSGEWEETEAKARGPLRAIGASSAVGPDHGARERDPRQRGAAGLR
jgi:para-aminobenzoate synthetase component I